MDLNRKLHLGVVLKIIQSLMIHVEQKLKTFFYFYLNQLKKLVRFFFMGHKIDLQIMKIKKCSVKKLFYRNTY